MSDHRSTRQAGAATLSNITTLDNIEIFTVMVMKDFCKAGVGWSENSIVTATVSVGREEKLVEGKCPG